MNGSASAATKIKVAVLLLLGVIHVFATVYLAAPGYLSIDETVYHWSAKEFATRMSLDIRNGYEDRPSPELVHPFLRVHDGKLYSQYPAVFSILAAPFYRLAGYYGLFLMNALAFAGVVVLCYATAKRLFGDMDLALNAALILSLATFAWEYSQAAWPHMVSTCFTLGAFYFFVRSYYSADKRMAMLFALCSGVVAGLGPGIRNDGICVFPLVVIPFVCSRSLRVRELLMFLAGVLPGIEVLSWINSVRFGMFTPFSDGNVSLGLGRALMGSVLLTGFLVLLTRPVVVDGARKRKALLWAVPALVVLLVFLMEPARRFVGDMLLNSLVSTIDIRFFPDIARPGMGRGAFGEVIYLGALKKALLQSLPFLAILALPMVRAFRPGSDSGALRLLWLAPIIYVGFYAYSFARYDSYEGGKCLNMRYFVVILPFLAILCARAVRDLRRRWGTGISLQKSIVTGAVVFAFYFLSVHMLPVRLEQLVFPLLIFPPALAVFLLCFLAAGEFLRSPALPQVRKFFFILLAAAFTWSGLTAFLYDYPLHRGLRSSNYAMGEMARAAVPTGSVFFAVQIDPYMRVIEDDAIMAFPHLDKFADFPALLEFELRAGRRAYAMFPDDVWRAIMESLLAKNGYEVVPRGNFKQSFLGEITISGKKQANGGS